MAKFSCSLNIILRVWLIQKAGPLFYENEWTISNVRVGVGYNRGNFNFIENASFYSLKDSIWLTEMRPYSQNEFLCSKVNAYARDTINGKFAHSPYEFILLNTHDWSMTKFFKYKSFNPDYQGDTNYIPNITKYATNGNSEFVAFDYFTKKAKIFHEDSLITELPTSDILKKYRKDDKDIILVDDLFLTKDKAAIVFSKKEDDSTSLQIMLVYDFQGNLIAEGTYKNNDKLLETYCLDLDDQGLILLNKWRYKRWTIDSFKLE